MSSKKEYQPVERSSDEIEEDTGLLRNYVKSSGNKRWEKLIWIGFILTIVVTNVVWFGVFSLYKQAHQEEQRRSMRFLSLPRGWLTTVVLSYSYQRTSSTNSLQIHYAIRRCPSQRTKQAVGRYVPS